MTKDKMINGNFVDTLERHNVKGVRNGLKVLQLNLGKLCNQKCVHCHVGAGPDRTEQMSHSTVERVLHVLRNSEGIETVDITGGAPELNPDFKYLVRELRKMGKEIIDRCNLTVFFEKGQEETMAFLAEHEVRIIASMPCYLEENVNSQRGETVYEKSIKALKQLNESGYGMANSKLQLDLVYNPGGATLPPEQKLLEADYKANLLKNFGIHFNRLLTITNMPINRFAEKLKNVGKLEAYCNLLANQFNPDAAERIMCLELVSIGWDGKIYDCDFNQALDIPIKNNQTIWDIESYAMAEKEITFSNHCYGCTAGFGSSCKGALA